MSFLSENKKTIIPVGVVIAVLAIGTGILSAQVSSDKIAKNVSIAGVNLGGKTKAEALKAPRNIGLYLLMILTLI